MIGRLLPQSWYSVGSQIVDTFYYPGVGLLLLVALTTLYKVALPKTLPWHRLLGGAILAGAFFILASAGLRRYLTWISDHGYTYGALAAPIAFLLFTFFLGFAVVIGAEFNATVQEMWPARATRIEQWRVWLAEQADKQPSPEEGAVTNLTRRITMASPIRLTDLLRSDELPGYDDAYPSDPCTSDEYAPDTCPVDRPTASGNPTSSGHDETAEEASITSADDDPVSPRTPGQRRTLP